MIEKLDLRENVEIIPIKGSCHDYCLAKSSVLIKINELVDAVNKLQKDYDNVCIWVGEQKLNYNPDTTKGLSTLVEEPTDPYAEQRKWIGCLVEYGNSEDGFRYGILTNIEPRYSAYPFEIDNGRDATADCWLPHKSVIYKGDDNE